MEKVRWIDFLAQRLRSQILFENGRRAQTWVLAFLTFLSLGFALKGISEQSGRTFLYTSKALFLIFFHIVMLMGLLLPSLLRKGEKAAAGALRIKEPTSFVLMGVLVTVYSGVLAWVAWQLIAGAADMRASGLFVFSSWAGFLISSFYLGACLFTLAGFLLFPAVCARIHEKGFRITAVLAGCHGAVLAVSLWSYFSVVPVGSQIFFEQMLMIGLVWVFAVSSVVFLGRALEESVVGMLSTLELEVASQKLERDQDILQRYRECFVSVRLAAWLQRLSHRVASMAHDIAKFTHEAVSHVESEKPSETDLRLVEDRYRRARQVCSRLDRQNERFLLSISLFRLTETEREKAEQIKDQFSRQLRNAKLELTDVRRRIDEKLISLKNNDLQPDQPSEVPVEKVPLSR